MVRLPATLPHRPCGLTIVELLALVASIALLIFVLVPSLVQAVSESRRIACNSSLRSLAMASLTYSAGARQDSVIPVGEAEYAHPESGQYSYYAYGGKSGRGSGGQESIWSAHNAMGSVHRPLNEVIHKALNTKGPSGAAGIMADQQRDREAFRCPSDRGFAGLHHRAWRDEKLSSYDHYGTSFSANILWIQPTGEGEYLHSNSPFLRPASRIPNPANTILYMENAGRFAVFAGNSEDYGPPSEKPPGQLPKDCRPYFGPPNDSQYVAKGWHGEAWHFNMTFGDGHAAWLKMRGYAIALGRSVPASCPGEWQSCRCVLVRSRGWQLDTMPAPPVPSVHIPIGTTVLQTGDPKTRDFEIVP